MLHRTGLTPICVIYFFLLTWTMLLFVLWQCPNPGVVTSYTTSGICIPEFQSVSEQTPGYVFGWASRKIHSGTMDKEGRFVNRPPILDDTNYNYWKARMMDFLKSMDSKTWKVVVKGWQHPVVKDKDGKDTTDLKPEEDWSNCFLHISSTNLPQISSLSF